MTRVTTLLCLEAFSCNLRRSSSFPFALQPSRPLIPQDPSPVTTLPLCQPLRRTGFMLTALHDHYGADSTAIGAVFGAHGSGCGHLMSQAAWAEFKIIDLVAPQLLPDDVATLRTPGKKWGVTSAESVTALQARGVGYVAMTQCLGWHIAIGAKKIPSQIMIITDK